MDEEEIDNDLALEDEGLGYLRDFLAHEEIGQKEFIDFMKKLHHFDADKNERIRELRNELEAARRKSLAGIDAAGTYHEHHNRLEETWQMLSSCYESHEPVDRDIMRADEILPAIFYQLDFGFYPPPELLLLLRERFEVYMAAQGKVSLEEAFFGAPRRNAGNYAARSGDSYHGLATAMHNGKENGLSQLEVAEQYAEKRNIHVEPESLVRAERRRKKKHRQFYSDK